MSFCVNAPFNSVSFGQVSTALARELFRRDSDCSISAIGGQADFESQTMTKGFIEWFSSASRKFAENHSRNSPTFKLWHLNGGMDSPSKKLILFSFYELDSPTAAEINIAKNCDSVIFSSEETVNVFVDAGVNAHYVPLGFDSDNFKATERKYHDDDVIVFNLAGKFEKRKHHEKVLRAWSSKYGDDRKYRLQCAVTNPFFSEKDNVSLTSRVLGKKFFNISFQKQMKLNSEYNDFLNSSEIIIGMSGGEGWGLPEFQSVALGKHSVILDAHGYKGWANEENSVLVKPLETKIDSYDGVFFKEGAAYNQGLIYDFDEEEFIAGCEKAVERVESNKINKKGILLQKDFSVGKTLDGVLALL